MSGRKERRSGRRFFVLSLLCIFGTLSGVAYGQTPAPTAVKDTPTTSTVGNEPAISGESAKKPASLAADKSTQTVEPKKTLYVVSPIGDGLEAYDVAYIHQQMQAVVRNTVKLKLSSEPSDSVASHLSKTEQRDDCFSDQACLQLVQESVQADWLVDTRLTRVVEGWNIILEARDLKEEYVLGRAEGQVAVKEDLGEMGAQALGFLMKKLKWNGEIASTEIHPGQTELERLLQSETLAVKDRLATPGVRLLAVVFDAPNCERCTSLYDEWRALGFKYGVRGLSLLALKLYSDPKRCTPPTWNQGNFACDAGQNDAAPWMVDALSKGVLFDWKGTRLGEFQSPQQMQPLIEEQLGIFPKILVDSPIYDNGKAYGGKRGRKLHKTIRERVASYAKFEILKTKKEKKALRSYRKELARLKKVKRGKWVEERVACPNDTPIPETAVLMSTVARSRKEPWVRLDYYSPEAKCFLASVEQPVVDKDYDEAAGTAAGKTVEGFVNPIQAPKFGKDETKRQWVLLTIPEPEKKKKTPPPAVLAAGAAANGNGGRQQPKPQQKPAPPAEKKQDDQAGKDSEQKEDEAAKKEFELPWFTLAPKSGYAYYMKGSKAVNEEIDARHAAVVALGLDMGGDGAAFSLEPTYVYESFGNGLDQIHMLGLHMGFNHRWVINRWAIPSLGFGIRSGYLMGDTIDYGLESYARLPIGYTFYPVKHLGITAEFAFGYGMTGLAPKGAIDKLACEKRSQIAVDLGDDPIDCSGGDFSLTHGMLLEFMLGIRFP